jgi:hypothetical protein
MIDPDRMSHLALNRIKDMGRIEERIIKMSNMDIFERLSKHDDYFNSTDEEKLQDIRSNLMVIREDLWDIMNILSKDE